MTNHIARIVARDALLGYGTPSPRSKALLDMAEETPAETMKEAARLICDPEFVAETLRVANLGKDS